MPSSSLSRGRAATSGITKRVQQAVDHRFNRSRMVAIERMSKRLAPELDLVQMGRELEEVASQTM